MWLDGVEQGWAIPLMLAGFAAVWFTFLVIAYHNADLHPDVLETWTLGRTFEWGNSKHPPLMGWVARAWTSFFPSTDWSLQLMAMSNAALALWCVDLISRRFVKGDKRILVLLLLMLLPTYQFHAQRFNANSVLLVTWPLATYCFLRSFESRLWIWAAAAGATAALAMLGKYYSIFLIGSFAFAAICHPQRRAYFGSAAPVVSAAAGLLVLGPHLYWLATTGAAPFGYALTHAGIGFGQALMEALFFLLGIAATLALPAASWVMITGYRLQRFFQDFRDMNDGLLLLSLIAVGTLAFPMLTAVVLETDLPPLWAHQGLFLPGVLIVCGTSYPIKRFYTVNLAAMVVGISLIAVFVAAPIHAIYRNNHAYEEGRNFYRLAAAELTRQWHDQTDQPLPAVSGDDSLAFAAAFYSPDHPVYAGRFFPQYAWGEPRQTTAQRGWAAMCFEDNAPCIEWMRRTSAQAKSSVKPEFIAEASLMGQPGVRRRIVAVMVPPDSNAPPPRPSANTDVGARRRLGSISEP